MAALEFLARFPNEVRPHPGVWWIEKNASEPPVVQAILFLSKVPSCRDGFLRPRAARRVEVNTSQHGARRGHVLGRGIPLIRFAARDGLNPLKLFFPLQSIINLPPELPDG